MRRKAAPLLMLVVLAGCALYTEVEVTPLAILPSNIDRGTDLQSMLRKADYLSAIDMAPEVEGRQKRSAPELAALGSAFLAAGRLDDARARLRAALDLDPFRTTYAEIAWNLSQVEYLANNFESSLEWATIAQQRGLGIRPWHMEYLKALSTIEVYRFRGTPSAELEFEFGKPDVPRTKVRANGQEVEGIIDSGAVISIISQRLAESLPVRSLGQFEGTFYGLLGEPIAVKFGIIESLELRGMVVENVPVAIMPDAKMRFLISRREGAEFRMDFLLGSNLLKEFRVDLDFDRARVTFTRLTERDRRPGDDQNLFYDGFRPHVRGAINRRAWYMFVFDTGSEVTFLNKARLHMLPVAIFSSGVHSATLQGLGGATKYGEKLENVEIGVDNWGGRFKTLPMYEAEDKTTAVGIIGQDYLQNFNVVIDFGRMKVDLKRR